MSIKTPEHLRFSNTGTLYDSETGEAMVYGPASTHKVVNMAQSDAYTTRETAITTGRGLEFTIAQMERLGEVSGSIAEAHCGYLLYLQCFVNYGAILENPNGSVMKRVDILRVLNVSRPTFTEFIDAMEANDIITQTDAGYRVNPLYHFRGRTDNPRVIKTFVATIKRLYSEVSAKDLGFVYKLLAFVHYETNTICANPYEVNVEHTIPLTKEDIAGHTGVTLKTVYNKLRNLKFDDQYVFAEVIYGKSRYYRINPFIFYRKVGVADASLREMFSIRNSFGKSHR